ncbi:hypothetical protein SAY87_004476 [Trapa incisa]|uniref:Thaumatin-like protein n=1 Tax=Trapa incisa TaxID=236973 RepID=A0AAN7PMD1_9MYRT|nr:hypothetical protein SAY87_004476 [Trapa incisa]
MAPAVMAELRPLLGFLLMVLLAFCIADEVSATTLMLFNKCPYTVWPGIQPGAGNPVLAHGGFALPSHKAYTLQLPALWSGRFWGRHDCTFDASGRGHCATGDCGGSLYCNGVGARRRPPWWRSPSGTTRTSTT